MHVAECPATQDNLLNEHSQSFWADVPSSGAVSRIGNAARSLDPHDVRRLCDLDGPQSRIYLRFCSHVAKSMGLLVARRLSNPAHRVADRAAHRYPRRRSTASEVIGNKNPRVSSGVFRSISCPGSCGASGSGSDVSACAAPWLRSGEYVRASPRTAGRPLRACGRCSCRCRSACAARAPRAA